MSTNSDPVQIRRDGHCGTIMINRPERRNALSRETVTQLSQALDDFMSEKSVRSVILTGAGDVFCSGTDLHELKAASESSNAFEVWHDDAVAVKSLVEKMLRFPKPIIASVNGWAVGTGLAIVLASDIVVGGESARLMMPEAIRGLNPGVTTPLLSFRIGTGMASGILFSGAPVSADEAKNLGLFHQVVGDDLIWARCVEIAGQCASGARESHQMTKQMINETIGERLFTELNIGAANMAAARTTPAAAEGVSAFLEKREPNWG